MDDKKIADETKDATAATTEPAKVEDKTETKADPQDPIVEELGKIEEKKKTGRSELDKAYFSLEKTKKRIVELGGVVDETEDPPESDDDRPLTVGELRRIEAEKAQKTALNLADSDVENENERKLVKYHLQNTIMPSGNPAEDLKNARLIVNAVKNRQIVEDSKRKPETNAHSKGSGAPARNEPVFVPTADEAKFMQPPYNLTKEKIISARKAAETK